MVISNIDQKILSLLYKMFDYEVANPIPDFRHGWSWDEVQIHAASINSFVLKGYVKNVFSTNSCTEYLLTEKGKETVIAARDSEHLERQTAEFGSAAEGTQDTQIDYDTMFSDIVGYDNIKELIRDSMQLEKPIHVLLAGPPAVAKTMFLSEIERVAGDQAMWLLGSGTSKAGLWEAIIENKPKYLLIDELDKMAVVDYAALLSLMEKGRLTRTKVGKNVDLHLTVWVFASCNEVAKIPKPVRSRFKEYNLVEYTPSEFIRVVTATLVKHEGLTETESTQIAIALAGKSNDVRDAVRVARLSKRKGVKKAIELIVD